MQKDRADRAEERLSTTEDELAVCLVELDKLRVTSSRRIADLEATFAGAQRTSDVAAQITHLRNVVGHQHVTLGHQLAQRARQAVQMADLARQRDAAVAAQQQSTETIRKLTDGLVAAQRARVEAIERAKTEAEAAAGRQTDLHRQVVADSAATTDALRARLARVMAARRS